MCNRVLAYTDVAFGGVEQFVSYLPLSHIASQLIDIYVPMATAGTVWFAQPDAMKVSIHCFVLTPFALQCVRVCVCARACVCGCIQCIHVNQCMFVYICDVL